MDVLKATNPVNVPATPVILLIVISGVPLKPCALVASVAVLALPFKAAFTVVNVAAVPVILPLKFTAVATPVTSKSF